MKKAKKMESDFKLQKKIKLDKEIIFNHSFLARFSSSPSKMQSYKKS